MKKYRIFLAIGGKATSADKIHLWVKNLYDPLVALGHDVYLLDIDKYVMEKNVQVLTKEAKEIISNDLPAIFDKQHAIKPFDLLFTYFHEGLIYPAVYAELKAKTYTVNYSTNFHQFPLFEKISAIADCNIYISRVAEESYKKLGKPCYWMPLAANPTFYKTSNKKNDNIVFIGSEYGNRAYLFWRLLQYHIPLQIYGSGWKKNENLIRARSVKVKLQQALQKAGYKVQKVRTPDIEVRKAFASLNEHVLHLLNQQYPGNLHGPLDDEAFSDTLSNSGIVLNIAESRYGHDFYDHNVLYASNLRDFETTMSGTFLCTQYSAEIETLFDIGKEVIVYHNEHDAAEKLKYYSKNISARDSIAKAGHLRALRDHTWENRFNKFFEFLNL
jgi:spore maturation protein CgeB